MTILQKLAYSVAGTVVVALGLTAPAQANLINYSFEDSQVDLGKYKIFNESDVSGWQSTDRGIEIWGNGFQGVSAAEGDRFAEINAYINGSLFQEVSNIDMGQKMGFSFFHRARVGTDVMNLAITDLGIDNLFGTTDDTVLFTKDYSATTEAWVNNTSANEADIMTLGNNMRFAYSAVSTGSGNSSIGNFIDAAKFDLASNIDLEDDAQDVPEPVSALAVLAIGAVSIGGIKRKQAS